MEKKNERKMLTPVRTKQRRIQLTVRKKLQQIQTRKVTTSRAKVVVTNEESFSLNSSFSNNNVAGREGSFLDSFTVHNICNSSRKVCPPAQNSISTKLIESETQPNPINQLAQWSLKNNLTHKALSELLILCREWMPKIGLPKDARTLLKTPRNLKDKIINIPGGKFYNFGIENSLRGFISKLDVKENVGEIDLT